MNPFEALAVLGMFSIIGFTVFGTVRALANAWARRVAPPHESRDELLGLIAGLQDEIENLRAELDYRVNDLDERVDFSERMLDARDMRPRTQERKSRVIGLTPT